MCSPCSKRGPPEVVDTANGQGEAPLSSQAAWARIARGPVPAWVEPIDPAPAADCDQPIEWLLNEEQIRFDGQRHRFVRHVGRAVTDVGVDSLAERRIHFNPSFEKIIVHHLLVIKPDSVIDARADAEEDLIRIERDLYARVYCGDYLLVIQLRDLEAGDILDFAFSIVGEHPALAGRVMFTFDFAFSITLGRHFARAIVPCDSPVHLYAEGTAVERPSAIIDGWREWRFDRRAPERVDFEPAVPHEHDDQARALHAAGFADWNAVARWAAELYRIADDDVAVAELAAAARATDPAAPELAAIAHVQERIRYVAANFGEGGLRPRAPGRTLSRRWGDCKDKSLLLVAVLRRLGHPAEVALVNTHAPMGPLAAPPGPGAFNHAIVRAVIAGETHWIDATSTGQVAPLAVRGCPAAMAALVARPDADALVILPPLDPGGFGEESHSVHDLRAGPGAPVLIEYASRYFGADAEARRRRVRAQGREQMARDMLDWESSLLGPAEAIGEYALDDDTEANIVTERSALRFDDPWIAAPGGRQLYRYPACAMNALISDVGMSRRRYPVLLFDHPVKHVHREDFLLPAGPPPRGAASPPIHLDNAAFAASRTARIEGGRLIVVAETRSKRAHIAADDLLAARRDEAQLVFINRIELEFPAG